MFCGSVFELKSLSLSPLVSAAMGGKKKSKNKLSSTEKPGEWLESTRRRLEEEGSYTAGEDRTAGPRWKRIQDETLEPLAQGLSTTLDASTRQASYEAAWRLLKYNLCLKLASFEPANYTMVIAGRPVQVIMSSMPQQARYHYMCGSWPVIIGSMLALKHVVCTWSL